MDLNKTKGRILKSDIGEKYFLVSHHDFHLPVGDTSSSLRPIRQQSQLHVFLHILNGAKVYQTRDDRLQLRVTYAKFLLIK